MWFESPANYTEKKRAKEKTSTARSYCIERKRVSAAGLRPREFTDLICCCIILTNGSCALYSAADDTVLKYCNAGGWPQIEKKCI